MAKKIKMRKWFIFSLLFTFLLTISFANVKAITEDDITNLNNTTWTFNNSVDSGWYGTMNNILFEDVPDGNVFNAIEVGENPETGIMYIWFTLDGTNDTFEVYNLDDGWINSTPYTITFKSDITDSAFVSFIKSNATYIDPDPVVTHDIYFSNYDVSNPITASDSVYYQINNDGVWRSIVDSNNTLPRWVNGVSSIQFKNETLTLDLVIYNYDSIFAVLVPGLTSATYTVTESLDLKFILESSDVPDVPTDPDNPNNYIITGGYKFNDRFEFYTSNLEDFYFTNYFAFPTNFNDSVDSSGFIDFVGINFTERTSTSVASMRYLYDNGNKGLNAWSDYDYTGLGYWYQYNNPIIYTQYIKFDNLSVSQDVYNWLNSNGEFGDFDYTDLPDSPTLDGNVLSDFLLSGLNGFLQFELVPGFSLLNLLALCVSIPILIYILKLFLGG